MRNKIDCVALNRVDPINFLRVFATMVVFIAHTNVFSSRVLYTGIGSFFLNAPAWSAMWIFFTLSGYLAGKNFFSKKYELTFAGIKKYYIQKFVKVYVPTVLFILIACILSYPEFIPEHPLVLREFLLCIYGSTWGSPAVDGVGATWFVFTLMWLYFIAPLLSWVASNISQLRFKIHDKLINDVLYLLFIILFLLGGQIWKSYVFRANLDYFHYSYTPAYANISCFAVGIFCGYWFSYKKKAPSLHKIVSTTLLLTITLLFSYIIYCSGISHKESTFWQSMFSGYKTYGASIVSVVVLYYIYAFDCGETVRYSKLSLYNIAKNPSRLIDSFACICFEFYLFHSLILSRISNYLRDPFPIQEYLKLLVVTFLISTIASILFSKAVQSIYACIHVSDFIDYCRQNKRGVVFIGTIFSLLLLIILLIISLPY